MTDPNDVINVLGSKLLIDKNAIVVDLKRSQGSWVVDERTGRQYLDCFSQFASQALGWNHPKMTSQKERLADAAVNKVANSDMYTTQFADFVKKFSEFTQDFPHHFYICGGALAVENALKAAFDWKAKKMGISEDRAYNSLQIIYLQEAFHGRSGYTMSMTNNGDPRNPKTYGFPKFNWKKIHNPKVWHNPGGVDEIKARNSETIAINEARKALERGNVAAIILEPIQGEGGDNHFRYEFFSALRRLADEKECLLIFDEVQTGMGMTGKAWAYQHFDIKPDIMCFGKKVQVCGICGGERLDEVKDNVFTEASRINSTWGGNIVDMVRSTMQMEIIQDDDLISNAKEVGEYFLSGLKQFHGKVNNIRGRGLMLSFDLDSTDNRNSFLTRLEENVLALPCGKKSVRFRPHLTFSKMDVDEAVRFIEKAL
ncbi:L-lysine 6-transaminase [bacterium]|nr:L-lysine 6-transaminase [bacterium]